jgi:chloramphenicol O-acetyltransferase type A
MKDPFFAVTVPIEVTTAYQFSKRNGISFFARYLHDCLKAINNVSNLKYRIVKDEIIEYDVIHASPTLMRSNNTYGFSFIHFDEDLRGFIKNIDEEKQRIEHSDVLYPEINSLDCFHCSAIPWLNFSGHKEPVSGQKDSVPKLSFSKTQMISGQLMMNVSISVNHALADGYHVGQFVEYFQSNLNTK